MPRPQPAVDRAPRLERVPQQRELGVALETKDREKMARQLERWKRAKLCAWSTTALCIAQALISGCQFDTGHGYRSHKTIAHDAGLGARLDEIRELDPDKRNAMRGREVARARRSYFASFAELRGNFVQAEYYPPRDPRLLDTKCDAPELPLKAGQSWSVPAEGTCRCAWHHGAVRWTLNVTSLPELLEMERVVAGELGRRRLQRAIVRKPAWRQTPQGPKPQRKPKRAAPPSPADTSPTPPEEAMETAAAEGGAAAALGVISNAAQITSLASPEITPIPASTSLPKTGSIPSPPSPGTRAPAQGRPAEGEALAWTGSAFGLRGAKLADDQPLTAPEPERWSVSARATASTLAEIDRSETGAATAGPTSAVAPASPSSPASPETRPSATVAGGESGPETTERPVTRGASAARTADAIAVARTWATTARLANPKPEPGDVATVLAAFEDGATVAECRASVIMGLGSKHNVTPERRTLTYLLSRSVRRSLSQKFRLAQVGPAPAASEPAAGEPGAGRDEPRAAQGAGGAGELTEGADDPAAARRRAYAQGMAIERAHNDARDNVYATPPPPKVQVKIAKAVVFGDVRASEAARRAKEREAHIADLRVQAAAAQRAGNEDLLELIAMQLDALERGGGR